MAYLREILVVVIAVRSVSADHCRVLDAAKHVVAVIIHRTSDLNGELPNHLCKVANDASIARASLVIVVDFLVCVPGCKRSRIALVV